MKEEELKNIIKTMNDFECKSKKKGQRITPHSRIGATPLGPPGVGSREAESGGHIDFPKIRAI
jgi:hypothetical protein